MPKRNPVHMTAQRERIVRAAIVCISEKGIDRTSIARICEQAKLSTGALYVHFKSKDEIISEALRLGTMTEAMLSSDWTTFKANIVALDSQMGFDVATAARARLHLYAECAHPGLLHDLLKPQLLNSLSVLVDHIQRMVDKGNVVLRMSAVQTALSIGAFVDGMLWIALSSDRSLEELKADLSAGLDCFVADSSEAS